MSRYIRTVDLFKSLGDFVDGKKSIGQCIDDTPTARIIPIEVLQEIRDEIADKYNSNSILGILGIIDHKIKEVE